MAPQPSWSEFQLTGPSEPISALAFFPHADSRRVHHLLVGSWDKCVRLYDLSKHAESALLQTFEHPAAVLDVVWVNESLAASACLDMRVRLLNTENGQSVILGKHESGVSRVRYDEATGLLFSGSWDATLKVWDPSGGVDASLRHTISLPGKVFAMDVSRKTPTSPARLVIAMPERAIHIYDTQGMRDAMEGGREWSPEQERESSLKFMLRDVRCMPDALGYVTSSVEGRVAVEFFSAAPDAQANKYAFKCHRKEVDGVDVVYPIHTIAFHPIYGTFATCGGDAHCALWDPVAKKRIRQYVMPSPVSTAAFSADGSMLVIACGADNLDESSGEAEVAMHVKCATDDARPKTKGASK